MAGVNRRWFSAGRGDRGAELIELAIVLPILLFVFAGIVDFGFLFQRYEAVTNAAREGARLASLPGYNEADVDARVISYLDASGLTGAVGTDVYVNQARTQTLPGGQTVSLSEVVVFYPAGLRYLGPIAALVGGTGHGSFMLRGTSVMRNEVAASGGS